MEKNPSTGSNDSTVEVPDKSEKTRSLRAGKNLGTNSLTFTILTYNLGSGASLGNRKGSLYIRQTKQRKVSAVKQD